MRLLAIHAKNYRIHADTAVEFDPQRTIVCGPNESGKSTLVEAAHRALFLKAKTGGEAQKKLVSRLGGHPEVTVRFEAGDSVYTIHKRFSGPSGSATLIEDGGGQWTGDEAEERLANLLGVEVSGGGRGEEQRVQRQWAHVWIWQGDAGGDPATHANTHVDDLLARLQRLGGAVVAQSELDARVVREAREAYEAAFTDKGAPRKNSDLELAQSAVGRASAAESAARAECDRLAEAAEQLERAERAIATQDDALRRLQPEREALQERERRAQALRAAQKLQDAQARVARERLEDLVRANGSLERMRQEREAAEKEFEPLETEVTRLNVLRSTLRKELAACDAKLGESAQRATEVRRRAALLDGFVAWFERCAQTASLRERAQRVQAAREERAAATRELAQLPEVSPRDLQAIEQSERAADDARLELDAMGVGVERVSGDARIVVGRDVLDPGSVRHLTDVTEIRVGDDVVLRVSPGGGTRLEDARRKAADCSARLREALERLALPSVAEVRDVVTRRAGLAERIGRIEERLVSLDAESIDAELSDAHESVVAARAEIDRRRKPEDAEPPDEDSARAARVALDPQLAEIDAADETAQRDRKGLARQLDEATSRSEAADREIQAKRRVRDELIGRERQLVEEHGDDAARAQRLEEYGAAARDADAALAATRRELEELDADRIDDEIARVDRALDVARKARAAAANEAVGATALLRRDGSVDPSAVLARAERELAEARERERTANVQADAIRLLHQSFTDAQRELAARFTRPLAERVESYLRCAFGPRCGLRIEFDDGAFRGMQFLDGEGGAYAFDELSGGTKEQVAAAVRFAIADLLAEEHDGNLPQVLDEAFAYSDEMRMRSMQSMLDLAARRGLQIIVLTNDPRAFAGLGAKSIELRARPSTRAAASAPAVATGAAPGAATGGAMERPDPDSERDVGDGESEADHRPREAAGTAAVTEGDRDELLGALRDEGGKCGNIALRNRLGWDETRYRAVKDDLLGRGIVVAGRGRGGSLSLTDAAAAD